MGQVTIQQVFDLALQHHQAGRLAEAETIYRQILSQQPGNIDAMHLLGVVAHQTGRNDVAVELIRGAIALRPTFAQAHSNLGNALKDLGRLDEAVAAFGQAIALDRNLPEAHNNLGNVLRDKGELDEAIAAFRRAIALRPAYAAAHGNLGTALKDKGRLDEAIAAFRAAIALNPEFAQAHSNLGNALREKGEREEAIAEFRRAIAQRPNVADVHVNLGNVLRDTGKLEEAIAEYRQAIALRPNYAEAHSNLGNAVKDAGRLDEAITAYREAIRHGPAYADAHVNIGNALKEKGQLDEAIAALRRAVALKPGDAAAHVNLADALRETGELDEAIDAGRRAIVLNVDLPEAHNNLGNALRDKGQLDEAIAAYARANSLDAGSAEFHGNLGAALRERGRLDQAVAALRRAIALKGDYAEAHGNLGNALRDLGQLDEAIAAYARAMEIRPGYAEAHSNLIYAMHFHPGYETQAIAEEHRRWNRQHAEPLGKFIKPLGNSRDRDRRLRVGYVSADFRRHSVSRFLLPLFRHHARIGHDHVAFEIICYSDVAKEDGVTASLRACADGWRKVVGYTDERVAEKIREDGIDILVDLAGHTAGNRLLVFARRAAPVQITYLGYPGTTGLPEMDFRLSDSFADPPGMTEALHSETLWRLPVCNWCYGEPDGLPAVRASRGNGPICFGTFNNFAKASPAVMELWAEILRAAPSSRLMIKSPATGEASVRRRTAEFFESRGVRAERLELRGLEADVRSHLEVYNQTDIALDTFPYHGTTTTCEAMSMGVPVVTLAGKSHVSRVGVSLLSCVGLAELIAQTGEEYVAIAVKLAKDLPRLADLRGTLRPRMCESPLMDAPKFAWNVEAAYRQMWQGWCEKACGGISRRQVP
jgi:protein O-GlcNAc transferase